MEILQQTCDKEGARYFGLLSNKSLRKVPDKTCQIPHLKSGFRTYSVRIFAWFQQHFTQLQLYQNISISFTLVGY